MQTININQQNGLDEQALANRNLNNAQARGLQV
jgi:hypothetical protein